MKYQQGLRRSLKSHFGVWFTRLDALLETIPATLPHTKHFQWQRVQETAQSGAQLKGGTGNKVLSVTLTYTRPDGTSYRLRSELKKGRAFGAYERAFANCLAVEIGRVVNIHSRTFLGSSSADAHIRLSVIGCGPTCVGERFWRWPLASRRAYLRVLVG